MNIILFDSPATKVNLLPFTFTRPIADIRIGILTIREKWEKWLPGEYSYLTDPYLQVKYPQQRKSQNLYINGSVLPDASLVQTIRSLEDGEYLTREETLVAAQGDFEWISMQALDRVEDNSVKKEYPNEISTLSHVCDIFSKNRNALADDFQLLTKGRKSAGIADIHSTVYQEENVFVEEGVKIRSAVINAENGPVYLGKNVEIGEGSVIRGATAICEGTVLNLGTRIRGDSTIGPFSKVGGEISNSVILGYSSKSHDGFLGNSVVGEWCNIGADSNTSNLKNNYKDVRIWNYGEERFVDTGRQFCGLMMGDHSKCGINTMFNTGTVVGVSANIFGSGFPRTFIPSFSWGGAQGFVTFTFEKALEVMPKVLERRNKSLTEADVQILEYIFETTKKYRQA